MKTGGFIKNLIFFITLICLWIFPHLYLSTEINVMKNEARNLSQDLKAKSDLIERLIERELKPLKSEDNIVKIAQDSLGLIRSLQPFDEIDIDGNRIKQIERIVNEEYE